MPLDSTMSRSQQRQILRLALHHVKSRWPRSLCGNLRATRGRWRTALSLAIAFGRFCCSGFADVQPQSVDELVAAHLKAIERVRDVSMRIEVSRTHWRGEKLDKVLHLQTWHWARSETEDRQRYEVHPIEQAGTKQRFGDLIVQQDEYKVLMNWNPAVPKKLGIHDQQGVKGWFGPVPSTFPQTFPNPSAQFALLKIQANLNDIPRTLPELVALSPKTEFSKKVVVGDKPMVRLIVAHPDSANGGAFAKGYFMLYFDPAASYMLAKVTAYIDDIDYTSEAKVPIQIEREVLQFTHAGEQALLPVSMRATLLDMSDPSSPITASQQELVAHEVVFNEPLHEDALAFRFPENLRVIEHPALDGIHTIHLWGADDRSAKAVRDYTELGFLPQRELSESKGGVAIGQKWLIAVNFLVVILLMGFVFLRKWLPSMRRSS